MDGRKKEKSKKKKENVGRSCKCMKNIAAKELMCLDLSFTLFSVYLVNVKNTEFRYGFEPSRYTVPLSSCNTK
jgi:hypothetical protein